MKKIIHLSDLHIGCRKQNLNERFFEIIENIIFTKEPAENYVIVITGDIVDKANDSSSYEEAKMLLDILESKKFKVLVVPGNHDYGSGICANKKYVKKFKETFYGDENVVYPKLDIVEDIAFIGLDSMAEELHWYDRRGANGELGKAQRGRLDELLGDSKVAQCQYRVVYLHHHPFAPKILHELKDSKELGEILMKHSNIDAILFGHNHNFKIWNGKWQIKRCYDAGSSTRKHDKHSLHRVIDLSKPPSSDYEANFFMD